MATSVWLDYLRVQNSAAKWWSWSLPFLGHFRRDLRSSHLLKHLWKRVWGWREGGVSRNRRAIVYEWIWLGKRVMKMGITYALPQSQSECTGNGRPDRCFDVSIHRCDRCLLNNAPLWAAIVLRHPSVDQRWISWNLQRASQHFIFTFLFYRKQPIQFSRINEAFFWLRGITVS